MRLHSVAIALCALSIGLVRSTAANSGLAVKYLSTESVYLDGGKADGLAVGDHLVLTGKSGCTMEIVVQYVADHSASCSLPVSECAIAVGDSAIRPVTAVPDTALSQPPAVPAAVALQLDTTESPVRFSPSLPKSYAKPPAPRVNGTLSALYDHWNDRGESNLSFSQATMRFNLRARRLFGKEITFNVRSRGRYDQRQRAFRTSVSKNAWENRLWELSIGYEEPNAPVNLHAGRILPKRIGSIGYLDGLLIEAKASRSLRFGLFGGSEPRWAYAEGRLSINRAGAYVAVVGGEPGQMYVEQCLAAVGEYHGSAVSRRLLTMQGRVSSGTQWSLYNSIDLDLNEGWRKERSGKSLSVSSLYIGSNFRISSGIRMGISYDNRQNYWTLETQSIVDSLFDDRIRQGIRAQFDVTLPAHIQTSASCSLRKRAGDPDPTRTYSLYVNKSNLIRRTTTGSVQYASFTGPFDRGHNFSARLGDNIVRFVRAGVAYGSYSYSADFGSSHRTNHWVEISSQVDLDRRYFFSGSVEIDSGDDMRGTRLVSELGYRF